MKTKFKTRGLFCYKELTLYIKDSSLNEYVQTA